MPSEKLEKTYALAAICTRQGSLCPHAAADSTMGKKDETPEERAVRKEKEKKGGDNAHTPGVTTRGSAHSRSARADPVSMAPLAKSNRNVLLPPKSILYIRSVPSTQQPLRHTSEKLSLLCARALLSLRAAINDRDLMNPFLFLPRWGGAKLDPA